MMSEDEKIPKEKESKKRRLWRILKRPKLSWGKDKSEKAKAASPSSELEKEKKPRVCKTKKCKNELAADWELDICPDCAIRIAGERKQADAPPPRVCKTEKCKTELAEDWKLDVCPECATKALMKGEHIDKSAREKKPRDPHKQRYKLAPVDVGLLPKTKMFRNGAVCFILLIIIGAGVTAFIGLDPTNPFIPPVDEPSDYDWHGMDIVGWFSIEAWVTITADGRQIQTAMSLYHEYVWDEFAIVEEHGYGSMGITHKFHDVPLGANVAVRFSIEWGAWSPYSNVITVETEGEQKNLEWEWQGYTVFIAINRG